MTPEEIIKAEAEKRYPIPQGVSTPVLNGDYLYKRRRLDFIDAANFGASLQDKEIKLLNVEIDGLGSMLLTVQQDYIRCSKENAAMLVNCTNWKKLVAEKDKEIAANNSKHQIQLDLQWDAAKALETERDLLVQEITALKARIETLKDEFTKGYDYCKEYYKIID